MNATFARPVIESNAMVPKILVDPNPYDGQGVLEAAFWEYRNRWSWSETLMDSKSVRINAIDIEKSLGTLPFFVVSGGVLGILCRLVVPAASICSAISTISSIIGAPIGPTVPYYTAIVNIMLKAEYVGNSMIYANYFKSPDAFRYNSIQYKLGSLYVDAYIA